MVLQLCGALAPCRAAEEFLQSLLGSVSCHMLSLKHPGSARFLLSPEGQHLLRELEARFQCVFGTEHLAGAVLETDLEEVDKEPAPPSACYPCPALPPPLLRRLGGAGVSGALILSSNRWAPLRPCRPSLASPLPRGLQMIQTVTRRTQAWVGLPGAPGHPATLS